MNGIRAIHLLRGLPSSCMLYHLVNTSQQLPLLAHRASQYHLSCWKTAAVAQAENNTTSVLGAQILGALITGKIASPPFSEYCWEAGWRLVLFSGYFAYSTNKAKAG